MALNLSDTCREPPLYYHYIQHIDVSSIPTRTLFLFIKMCTGEFAVKNFCIRRVEKVE